MRCPAHFCIDGVIMFALAVCVGNNPDPISPVRGADGASIGTKWRQAAYNMSASAAAAIRAASPAWWVEAAAMAA